MVNFGLAPKIGSGLNILPDPEESPAQQTTASAHFKMLHWLNNFFRQIDAKSRTNIRQKATQSLSRINSLSTVGVLPLVAPIRRLTNKGRCTMGIDLAIDIQGSPVEALPSPAEGSGEQQLVPLDEILVVGERRSLQRNKLADLVESIKTLGLLSPIAVRRVGRAKEAPDAVNDSGSYQLVYGLHRLTAVRQLGWKEIPCRVFSSFEIKLGMSHLSDIADDDRHALMAEIAENLHRAELTALERAEHVAHWLKLKWGVQQPSGEKPSETKGKGRGRPQGGRSAAAREIGISEPDARRSEKIAALPDEVKAEAKVLGLDDNQAALLKATVAADPITMLRDHVTSSGPAEEELPPPEGVTPASGSLSAELQAAMDAVGRLGPEDRTSFLWWIEVTYGTGERRERVRWF